MIYQTEAFAQNQVAVNAGYGRYLKNSENSMKVLEGKKIRSFIHFGAGYQRENILGYTLTLEYSYYQNTFKDVMHFMWTDQNGNDMGGFTGDYQLINHTFDLNYCTKTKEYFSFGIGPSFVITNRILDVHLPVILEDKVFELYDKLASSGLGISGSIQFSIPLNEGQNHLYFTSKLKLRYTYSIWFDEGLRKLDDYYQEFFTAHFSIGLGYSFND